MTINLNFPFGANPFQINANPYVSNDDDWRKYANNGGIALIGMAVHYVPVGSTTCQAAKVIKVLSGWQAFAITIIANIVTTSPTGVATTFTHVPLRGRGGVSGQWHFASHLEKLIPIPVKPTPAPVPSANVYPPRDPLAPPSPTFTGAYTMQDSNLNGGACTYLAYNNGALVANQQVDCDADTTVLNQTYLGTADGYGKSTVPDSTLLGIDESKIKTIGNYADSNYSFAHDIFYSGGQSARGVEAAITPLSLSLTGTACSNAMATTSQLVMQEVKVVFSTGNYLTLALVNACSGVRYWAMLKTVGNNTSLIGTSPLTNPNLTKTIRIEQVPDTSIVTTGQVRFYNSPKHYAAMINPQMNLGGIGAYRADSGLIFFVQIFAKRTGNNPECSDTDTNLSPTSAPGLYQWDKGTYSTVAETQMIRQVNQKRASLSARPTIDLWPELQTEARYRAKNVGDRATAQNSYNPETGHPHAIPPNELVGFGRGQYGDVFFQDNGFPIPIGWHLVFDELDARGLCWNTAYENVDTVGIDGTSVAGGVPTKAAFDRWNFLVDGVVIGSTDCPEGEGGGASLSAGLETHGNTAIVPKHSYAGLKYKDILGIWRPWYGEDTFTVSSATCGRFLTDDAWLAAQGVSCA